MPLIAQFEKTAAAAVLGLALAALAAPAAQAAAAPAAAASPAVAGAAAPAGGTLRVAVIDTEKILLSSAAGKKAIAELKKIQEAKEAELRGKQQEIKELQDKVAQGRLSLAQDKLAELAKQLEDKEIALRRLSDDAGRELNKKKDDLLGSIDEKVMPVINQIGREQGYTMIFRKFESGLIYADDAIDITASVVQRLDAQAAVK
ncbi:MAG TPA: OmpH family outer membrane protein [Thermoanaerobaculia bacterium]|nr:OmpH family outer membrane protein [Thermoanaerobaculia bacterium]